MHIEMDLSSSSLDSETTSLEMEEVGAVMSHVYYGRGFKPSDVETIANVLRSFREARRAYGTVYLVWDEEDTGFGGADSDLERVLNQPIEDDAAALLTWWESYGFAGGEDAVSLQVNLAALCRVDPRMLTPAQ